MDVVAGVIKKHYCCTIIINPSFRSELIIIRESETGPVRVVFIPSGEIIADNLIGQNKSGNKVTLHKYPSVRSSNNVVRIPACVDTPAPDSYYLTGNRLAVIIN